MRRVLISFVLVAGCLVAIVFGLAVVPTSQQATSATPTPAMAETGETGYLSNATGTVVVANSADTLASAFDALAARDTLGVKRLVDAGELAQVPAGTRVLVIGSDTRGPLLISRVRILDGPHSGEAWWVRSTAATLASR
jgi:hypothetical protein